MIISNRMEIDVAIAGAVISIAVYLFVRKQMRYKPVPWRKVLKKLPRGFQYAGVLVWETAKANFSVLRIVFKRSIEIKPRLIYFHTDLKTNAAQVVLANSITLTPGTITAELDNGLFCVHCLDGGMDEGIDESVFVKLLRKFEE